MLIHNPKGHYRFLKGIDPYSCGVIADEDFEIIHVTMATPIEWRSGIEAIASYLKEIGEDLHALCAMQLRCPAPYPMDGFIAFNEDYCQVLKGLGLYVDEINPIARTNVAPLLDPPTEPQLFAFSHTSRTKVKDQPSMFVVAGAGELIEGVLDATGIVRRGDTGSDAMREKAAYVVQVMNERLRGLGADPQTVSHINIYAAGPIDTCMREVVIPGLPSAARVGLHWFPSYPPVQEIEFEMDLRGARVERRLRAAPF